MTGLTASVENMRMAALLEGENKLPALVYALATETADLGEAEILDLVRQARARIGGKEIVPLQAAARTVVPKAAAPAQAATPTISRRIRPGRRAIRVN